MITRRMLLQGSASIAASALIGPAANAINGGNPIRVIQNRIDNVSRRAFSERRARSAIVVGLVTPEAPDGQLLFAGQDVLTNPLGERLALDARTPFEIGSVSKVFTSGIYYMMHGPYEGTLGRSLGSHIRLSKPVAEISLKNLAIYEPGLPQDNQGGAYPPGTMNTLRNLFDYMAHFTPPRPQGTCYAYSNTGWALLSMAALRIDNTDTGAFVAAYNKQLKQFCSAFGAPNTSVFHAGMKPHLPIGYNKQLAPLPARSLYQPSNPPGYGSGGIISNGADMLRYLLYNMGRLPGGLSDPALAYQQTDTFQTAACSAGANGRGPITGYGWFHAPVQTAEGPTTVLNKNGGVAGFTSWMGFTKWQGTGVPSTHGVFVLNNGPRSTPIGMNAMKLLLGA